MPFVLRTTLVHLLLLMFSCLFAGLLSTMRLVVESHYGHTLAALAAFVRKEIRAPRGACMALLFVYIKAHEFFSI